MLRRLSLALVALVLAGLSAPAVAQLDIQYTPTCGKVLGPRTQGGFSINGCDRTLTLKQPDGSLATSTLLNAVTAGRKAVEVGDAGDLMAAPNGGVLRTLAKALSDEINVRALKADVCTGDATIDTAALNLAISKARLAPGSTIRLPACAYTFRSPVGTNGFRLPDGTTLRGDGPRTVVRWNDLDGTETTGPVLFGPNDPGTRTRDIAFRDFTVRGSADTASHATAYPFLITNTDGLTFSGLVVEYSRIMSIAARGSTDVSAFDNVIRYGKSDGINFAQCTRVSVRNNDIAHVNDDAIGVHSDVYDAEGVRDTLVIAGNRIFDAQGIRALSARKTVISANTLTNMRQTGISVETLAPAGSGFQEGASAADAVSITSNVITNVIDRASVDNFNQGATYIVVTGTSARKGGLAAIPGDAAGGTVPDPYREMRANSSSPAVATPGTAAIIISGNILARTLPGANGADPRFKKWSDLGQGPFWTNSGNVDPAVPETALQGTGISLRDGLIRDVLATDNVIRGLRVGLSIGSGLRFDNITFRGNHVIDMSFAGMLLNTSARLRAYITDNLFDLDPFHKSANRGAGGTWTAAGAPFAVYQQAGSGVFMRGNTFRNMGTIFNQGFGLGGFYWAENMVEADATVFDAYDATSKGIGNVPSNRPAFRYVRVGSDPANDNYGAVLAMPAYP